MDFNIRRNSNCHIDGYRNGLAGGGGAGGWGLSGGCGVSREDCLKETPSLMNIKW